MKVYLLKVDYRGSSMSTETSIGRAVLFEEEAKAFVEHGGVGYSRSYEEIKVYNNMLEVMEYLD